MGLTDEVTDDEIEKLINQSIRILGTTSTWVKTHFITGDEWRVGANNEIWHTKWLSGEDQSKESAKAATWHAPYLLSLCAMVAGYRGKHWLLWASKEIKRIGGRLGYALD